MTTSASQQSRAGAGKADQGSMGSAMSALFESVSAQHTGEALQPGSTATPFSTFFWAAIRYLDQSEDSDRNTAEAQFADDIEWDMMNNGQVRKGKEDVLAFCWAGGFASHKEPVIIHNHATRDWGTWEYWNIGTLTSDIIAFAKASNWAFPPHVDSLVGRAYRIPVCFNYHINANRKIDVVHEYLDTQSLMAQFM